MCELFGICSAEKILCNPYLKKFFTDAPYHPDGWGLARFYHNSAAIEKEPISAQQSLYLENRLTEDIEEDILLAHIRRASVGKLEYRNTHPFSMRDASGRLWTLIHNGTIFHSDALEPYKKVQKGACDSERILLYLVDQINAASKARYSEALTDHERFQVFDRIINEITPGNKVNLLAYDDETLYVHTNHPNSLYCRREGKGILVCTRPLDDKPWIKVPLNTLFGLQAGQPVFSGHIHTNLYLKENETAAGYDSLRSTDIFYI